MSTAKVSWASASLDVQAGWLRSSQNGPWAARVRCPVVDATLTTPSPGTSITLAFTREGGAVDTWVGTVRRAALFVGAARLEIAIVGGAGNLLTPLASMSDFVQVPSGLVLDTIAQAAGETLATGAESAVDAIFAMPRWHVVSGMSASQSLDSLASELARLSGQTVSWRILQDGTLWMGVESWPVSTYSAPTIAMMPDLDDRSLEYAPDGTPFVAGQSIDGAYAIEVAYELAPGELRARVRSLAPGDPVHAPSLDLYRASYPAMVVAQRSDGSLDVTCADPRIGSLTSVVIRTGVPGCTVQVPYGTGVTVRFASASPVGAYVADFDTTAPNDVVLTATGSITVQSTGQGTTTVTSPNTVTVSAPKVLLGPSPASDAAYVGSLVASSVNLGLLASAIAPMLAYSPSTGIVAVPLPTPFPVMGSIVNGQAGVQV